MCNYFFSDSTKQARRTANFFFEWWVFSVGLCGRWWVGRGKDSRGIANNLPLIVRHCRTMGGGVVGLPLDVDGEAVGR